jgi:ubiquinone/menaquinone biosynthesis C-methylase UbiE
MNRDKYTEANRVTWNETAGIHADVQLQGLLQNFRDPEFTTLDAIEKGIFARLGVEGKAVAQLSCNNGRELLSVKRLGAGRCVGFDISDAFIAQGRKLARSGQIEAEFVCSDVYRIPQTYDGNFDIIYVTIGALGWLPDLDGYFSVVARLLNTHSAPPG